MAQSVTRKGRNVFTGETHLICSWKSLVYGNLLIFAIYFPKCDILCNVCTVWTKNALAEVTVSCLYLMALPAGEPRSWRHRLAVLKANLTWLFANCSQKLERTDRKLRCKYCFRWLSLRLFVFACSRYKLQVSVMPFVTRYYDCALISLAPTKRVNNRI